ncbi:MAG: response regulator [Gemmataceae bacterium]|nr:response regulator [Gemmataceae bacterium]
MANPSIAAPKNRQVPLEPHANILLVDDSAANRLALRVVLDDLGYVIVEATSGEQGIARLEREDFAVVLLDLRMPGIDGMETARRIRADDRTRRTPLIFITAGDVERGQMEEAYSLGAVDFLIKPIIPIILQAKVRGFAELYLDKAKARREADQLRLLVHGTNEYAIFLLDAEGYVATWNPGAHRLKGYTADEIIGRHFSTFYPKEATDRGWPAQELKLAAADGKCEDEGWRVRKDGSTFWANVMITALKDESGRLLGFAKVTRDLTERKHNEDSLRQARDELEVKVMDRTRDLSEANAQLAESARRKDQFLAMLAHELRNPLAPVMNGLQMLRLSPADQGMLNRARDMMERQIRHLTRLVDDLLDVSRITHGKIPIRRQQIDLTAHVRAAAEDRRPLLEQAGLRLDLDLAETPLWVAGDPVRLSQVLNNLLDNAVKFRNGGDRVTVRLTADPDGRCATMEVRDHGIGIAPDLFPRLFEVFSQADRSLDRSRGGLGVGLSVVKGLVELHGGEVRAESDGPGQGAAFIVRLPLKHEVPAIGQTSGNSQEKAAEPLRILIVEDNRDAAESMRMLLEVIGHRVQTASDGLEGVEMARHWRPDVVLCDIGLPGLDGYGVADALRHDPATARARLIAVTGYGHDEDRERTKEAGFDYHLTKPVDARVLESLLVRPA